MEQASKHAGCRQAADQLARVERLAKEFFDALEVSSTNVSKLGKKLLKEIEALETTLNRIGATGLSLLVGNKDMDNEEVVQARLQALKESLLSEKENERKELNDLSQILENLLEKK